METTRELVVPATFAGMIVFVKKVVARIILGIFLSLVAVSAFNLQNRGKTPPIKDSGGRPVPGSIASLEKVTLGGMQQWILIRGQDSTNPVLLWLHGGPGAVQMPVARYFNGALEEDFIVVHWDQRGAGKSNLPGFDERTMTFQQFMNDGHELTQLLKQRFQHGKIYLVGHS